MATQGRPPHRQYQMLVDLLYRDEEWIERLPDWHVILETNKYIQNSRYSNTQEIREVIERLAYDGYVTDYKFRWGRLTCRVQPTTLKA